MSKVRSLSLFADPATADAPANILAAARALPSIWRGRAPSIDGSWPR